MKDIFLINYSVKGIKALDQLVSLSFYKKTISKNPDTQDYNIKGIYGMNGSGKSGIVTSVYILKNLLVNPGYLNNPIVQKNLDEMINKKLEKLEIEVDFIADTGKMILFFRYEIELSKDSNGKYIIAGEKLSTKNANSKSDSMATIFEVDHGEIIWIFEKAKDEFTRMFSAKTVNLLDTVSMCALFYEKILLTDIRECRSKLFTNLIILWLFGEKLYVYLDESDNHRDFIINNSFDKNNFEIRNLMYSRLRMDSERNSTILITENYVRKESYDRFVKDVGKLYDFLHIFKADLQGIEIDKKENGNIFVCSLIMVYDSYKIHAEFESTGIKKLIKLFTYIREMVQGGIVFIDEFDSNLHDVYLCALLEYLMEYGEGQLCFTTHNVGPMDVLKQNKKSIDFLSVDHKIYPWTTNGNYSPSKLYRNGMIEGSPFNVDSIDFIGVFDLLGEDE